METSLREKIVELLKTNYNGSYRFLKNPMFINKFGKNSYDIILNETNFLEGSEYSFSVRVRTYVEGITEYPKCHCGNLNKFDTNNGWQKTCSRKCNLQSSSTIEKRNSTNIEKYGAANVFASEYGKSKCKQTNMEKYGVDNFAKSEEFKSGSYRE